ncbi:MAG TPA: hypothetical protein ENI15_15550 [Spirochaetes bacterium]|nr:hypothetical protein [Spirochaetota bacterium]
MKSELIIMLTYNDETVEDAVDVFNKIKDLPIKYFGFKDIGLPHKKMGSLNNIMKKAGKETFLEVVRYTEQEVLESAGLAVNIGFDYLMGTLYYDSIWDLIDKKIKYLPFCGKVYDHPSVLDGTISEITANARDIESKGVDGFDLLAYRYKYRDKVPELIKKLRAAVSVPIVSAGSINSFDRLQKTVDSGVWAFTIGSAFFEKKFIPGGSYRENVEAIYEKLKIV